MELPFTKQNTRWKRLCEQHAKEVMICPCWIVKKDECNICNPITSLTNGDGK